MLTIHISATLSNTSKFSETSIKLDNLNTSNDASLSISNDILTYHCEKIFNNANEEHIQKFKKDLIRVMISEINKKFNFKDFNNLNNFINYEIYYYNERGEEVTIAQLSVKND